ncbi:MFS transporter (macronuclear) [Tetrahymena thermophila SB210]|uniref:MFS transporter n=1 Tax=Tetrahymena thermophila (strain SB210) TaxID=312017 RepID=I7M8Z4_TETTS|nr:MFS transporter [Tetrahymena thermophila SB210]EAS00340.2 MFS transporter [Tetrahymena thermophila SB210]|eukprot:XP_001020585.2 MFS transporter [Tetrahymena thermophila SB210]
MLQTPSCLQPNKNFIFSVILAGLFTTSLCLSIIGPFFPLKASDYDIEQQMVGIIYSGFPLGAISCTFLIHKQMSLHRKPFMITGIVFQVIAMIGFATLFLWNSKSLIICLAFLYRVFQGIGLSMFEAPSLSFLPLLFNRQLDEKIGLMEGVQSIGFMLGPLLGSLFYYVDGYQLVFYAIGIIQFLVLPITFFCVPDYKQVKKSFGTSKSTDRSSLSNDLQIQLLLRNNSSDEEASKISYKKSIKNYRIILMFCLIFLTAYGFLFLDSSFALYLDGQFGLDQHAINYIFFASYFCNFIACQIVSYFSNKQYNSIRICIAGFIISFICYLFLGPADIFPFQPILGLTIAMRCIISLSQSLVYIPSMKEFFNTLSSIFHLNQDDEQIGDMASTFYILAQQTGELFGPLIGDSICQYRSFQDATFYLGVFNVAAILILFVAKLLIKQDETQKIVYRRQSQHFYISLQKERQIKTSKLEDEQLTTQDQYDKEDNKQTQN